MSDSDSDSDSLSSVGIPSDDVLEKGLRDTVAAIFKKGNLEQLTVKRVRAATEKALTLDEGFYKNDEVWKAKSDRIIKQEAEKQEELAAEKEKKKPTPAPPKRVPPLKPKEPKRASSASQPARKRRRTATPSESEEDLSSPPSEESEEEEDEDEEAPSSRRRAPPAKKGSKPVKQAPKPKPAPKTDTSSDLSDVPDESDKTSERASSREASPMRKPSDTKHDESESDMSVVIDDEPPPKSKRRKSSEPSQQEKSKKSSKPASGGSRKPKDVADADPDLAEIKKLQGQLVKCGIRKMWFRELAPYDTPRAKVKHLRQMLKDAGMEGRFSLEKAKAIREARELQADLEVVREGAKRWGTKVSDEEAGNGARPRRRVARDFQALSFLEDEDGEETD
ncbi:transcriptional regulator [Blastomyces dermatitidis ER-3]|uniref:Transcriptional regulator n=1 Tax=Ajellomyces dermatitidis (strain ER-3 / ATCC MYA-2586) TaxID=559297 RepID=A0ABP2F0B2_AJEDR|nr:transcriptional regulator [Blastomyces dermatitidis ER-3]EEQ88447.1 transcriptional regulator [Blastomyces dermatitidis ER-3]EQL38517.1 hypothetical protein BDFG_00103 [Blastomyces dermatitidis ATCC 26199]